MPPGVNFNCSDTLATGLLLYNELRDGQKNYNHYSSQANRADLLGTRYHADDHMLLDVQAKRQFHMSFDL